MATRGALASVFIAMGLLSRLCCAADVAVTLSGSTLPAGNFSELHVDTAYGRLTSFIINVIADFYLPLLLSSPTSFWAFITTSASIAKYPNLPSCPLRCHSWPHPAQTLEFILAPATVGFHLTHANTTNLPPQQSAVFTCPPPNDHSSTWHPPPSLPPPIPHTPL